MTEPIDLRSDTVTLPSPEMRRAMYEAEMGDDYYRNDPTVRALEDKAADRLGKESALLVLSGTMGNLVAVLALTRPGQSIVCGETSHIYVNETGGLAAVAGLTVRPVKTRGAVIGPAEVEAAAWPNAVLHPPTTLVCTENTN
ncbi:MAG: threonine aldolase family protein, partial [Alphaproteobacteria bacterium]